MKSSQNPKGPSALSNVADIGKGKFETIKLSKKGNN